MKWFLTNKRSPSKTSHELIISFGKYLGPTVDLPAPPDPVTMYKEGTNTILT